MKYTGPLYGKIGRRTIPLSMSSTEVDRLQEQRNELLEALEKVWPFLEEDDGMGANAPSYQEAINAARAAITKAKEPLQ